MKMLDMKNRAQQPETSKQTHPERIFKSMATEFQICHIAPMKSEQTTTHERQDPKSVSFPISERPRPRGTALLIFHSHACHIGVRTDRRVSKFQGPKGKG
jgi:proteasome lid subunit RPN8/RPN11